MKLKASQTLSCLILITVLIACGESSPGDNSLDPGNIKEYNVEKPEAQDVIAKYLLVKDALVQTDRIAVSKAAIELRSAISESNQSMTEVRTSAEKIASAPEIELQRKEFEFLTMHIHSLILSTEANDVPLYIQHCPMAFDNKGASWISAEKQVNNPYFGDVMLHCGKVESTINPSNK